jgi:hypothetical protein
MIINNKYHERRGISRYPSFFLEKNLRAIHGFFKKNLKKDTKNNLPFI